MKKLLLTTLTLCSYITTQVSFAGGAQPPVQPQGAAETHYLRNGILCLFAVPVLVGTIKAYKEVKTPKIRVGVVSLKGVVMDSEPVVKELTKLFEDKTIHMILIKCNCPGGAVGSSQHIFQEILQLKKLHAKPIITFVENVCASGAYYIASATDAIIAAPSSEIGSIGVVGGYLKYHKLISQLGIEYEQTTAGICKGENQFTETTEVQRENNRALVDNMYEQFKRDVASQRSKLSEDTNKWAEARVFTGEQALELGLIDRLGSQSTVVSIIRNTFKSTARIDWIEKKETLLEKLIGQTAAVEESLVKSTVNSVCSTLESRYEQRMLRI